MIAVKQHGHADADREAFHRRDQGLAIVRNRLEKFDGVRPQRAALRRIRETRRCRRRRRRRPGPRR